MNDDELMELVSRLQSIFSRGDTSTNEDKRDAANFIRDYFAAQPPKMTEERRNKLFSDLICWKAGTIMGKSDNQVYDELAVIGVLPPRATPTPGERFAEYFEGDTLRKTLAKRFDEQVGPLIEACKSTANGEHSMGKSVVMANEALANFEAGLGGKP